MGYQQALGTRPDLPDYLDDFLQDDAYEKILGIFCACTSEEPSKRPSAKDILEILDSHEIWHASTEKWNQLGDERGLLPRTISVDDSLNADTEESSTHSDSVIELSSDEEEDFNNEESDDSSDIEILEEIPFKPIKTNENKSFEEAKEFSVSKETTDAISSTIDGDHAKDVTTTAKSIVSSENNIGVGGEEKDNEDEHTENEG